MAWPKGKPRPPGAGRKKGSVNKATADIKVLAQKHGPELIEKLLALTRSKDERVQAAAIKELLDRGYGRAAQPHTGADGEGPVDIIVKVVRDDDEAA